MKELPKSYNSDLEMDIYSLWEKSGLTNPDNMTKFLKEKGFNVKEPFTITLPPPNANGNLHLGHVCGYSFHDVMGRYMRMTGHPVLLLPGKDHAGIQTESVFTKKLEKECEWVQKLLHSGFFTAPVKKFGASDCWKKCISHLLVTTNNSFIENFPEYLHKSNIQFEQLFLFSWD